MKKTAAPLAIVCTFVLVAGLWAMDREEKPSVKTMPPVVVKTVPQSGDTNVDAAKTKEIHVTFSKKMTDQSWSWSQISEDTKLPISKIHYDKQRRTCIATVDLEPGKTYVSWLNSQRFGNFKDADGRSAVPYLLVFETKSSKESASSSDDAD
ncbi:MAG: Ig-like domain-containing protein [Phycisphaerales bacterium]|nr:MAG: Ig-like domain-containing protein [Phycisphaerales bacterium]